MNSELILGFFTELKCHRNGNYIVFDNFNIGFTTENLETNDKKLTYKHVKGGVLLVETDFTLQ